MLKALKMLLLGRLRQWLDYPAYGPRDLEFWGDGAQIDSAVYLSSPETVSLGRGAVIYRGTKVFSGPGRFKLGDGSHLAGDVYVNAVRGVVSIGSGVAVGPKVVIVSYTNHPEPGRRIVESHRVADVAINDDVFIGASAVILPGVVLGQGCVVAAGAVVTQSVAPNLMVGGVPARVIGQRGREEITNA